MRATLFALALCLASGSQASESDLQLVGQARLKFLFWSVYDSRLFSTDGRYSEGQRPLRLEITYLLDIGADALVERTAAEWRSQGRDHGRQRQWLQDLSRLWPDVSKNDVISLELDTGNRSTFYRNGELLGVIDDPAFGEHFLDIWLSPNTTRPELRLGLLGRR